MRGYPRYFGGLLYGSLLLVLLSGLALVPTFLEMRLQVNVPWRPDFSLRTGIAVLHTGTSLLVTWMLGALWSQHMRAGWRRRQNRVSGVLLVTCLVALMLTGLGILYAGNEMLSLGSSVAHGVAGVLLIVPGLVHGLAGRRLRRPGSCYGKQIIGGAGPQ